MHEINALNLLLQHLYEFKIHTYVCVQGESFILTHYKCFKGVIPKEFQRKL